MLRRNLAGRLGLSSIHFMQCPFWKHLLTGVFFALRRHYHYHYHNHNHQELGNLVKVDRFGYVREGMHGTKALDQVVRLPL